ncbi:MAG: hypothetical protein FWG71_07905, partial [Synergistaceae bacterium]|nr:hypothetical protein [Synergistaceae bacterium]
MLKNVTRFLFLAVFVVYASVVGAAWGREAKVEAEYISDEYADPQDTVEDNWGKWTRDGNGMKTLIPIFIDETGTLMDSDWIEVSFETSTSGVVVFPVSFKLGTGVTYSKEVMITITIPGSHTAVEVDDLGLIFTTNAPEVRAGAGSVELLTNGEDELFSVPPLPATSVKKPSIFPPEKDFKREYYSSFGLTRLAENQLF